MVQSQVLSSINSLEVMLTLLSLTIFDEYSVQEHGKGMIGNI